MWVDDKSVDYRYISTHRMLIHEVCYSPEICNAGAVLYASLHQHRSGVKARVPPFMPEFVWPFSLLLK